MFPGNLVTRRLMMRVIHGELLLAEERTLHLHRVVIVGELRLQIPVSAHHLLWLFVWETCIHDVADEVLALALLEVTHAILYATLTVVIDLVFLERLQPLVRPGQMNHAVMAWKVDQNRLAHTFVMGPSGIAFTTVHEILGRNNAIAAELRETSGRV